MNGRATLLFRPVFAPVYLVQGCGGGGSASDATIDTLGDTSIDAGVTEINDNSIKDKPDSCNDSGDQSASNVTRQAFQGGWISELIQRREKTDGVCWMKFSRRI
jgi:hypothetical protein